MDTDTSMMIPKPLQGFTLTEIMVALVISTILMGGVLSIMSSSKRTYALQNELSELQDNARFIIDELARELRMAGYFGCSSNKQPIDANTQQPIDLGTSFGDTWDGQSVNNRAVTDENGNPSPFPQTDALVISSFSEPLLVDRDNTEFKNNKKTITLEPRSILPEPGNPSRNWIIISDCGGSGLYRVAANNTANSKITLANGLLKNYDQPVEVFLGASRVAYEIKYIDEQLALYKCIDRNNNSRCETTEPLERLVEGVENMQIRYGIDTDIPDTPGYGIPDRYSETAGATDTVVSVRITLLMRTTDKRHDLEGSTKTTFRLDSGLTYNPQTKNYESGYRHRMFTGTIGVRNGAL